jgi:hypothetical protein
MPGFENPTLLLAANISPGARRAQRQRRIIDNNKHNSIQNWLSSLWELEGRKTSLPMQGLLIAGSAAAIVAVIYGIWNNPLDHS